MTQIIEPNEIKQARMHELRTRMGTQAKEAGEAVTRFVRGGEEVTVDMISGSRENWYRGMYVMAVQTWGGPKDSAMEKWNKASLEDRQNAVQSIIERKALPLALEHPQFLFEISGCSRSAFDQIARARIGVTFSSMGARDNPHSDVEFVTPPYVYDNPEKMEIFKNGVDKAKEAYADLLNLDSTSWQDARAVMPMGMMHRFCLNANYAALSTLCGKRLQFCEQYDTVMVAWKIRETLGFSYAMLAEALRPSCDYARKCTYHTSNELQEAFSCLFKGCGRWPDPQPYYEFNESSTNPDDINKWLGYSVPAGEDPLDWKYAREYDAHWFSKKWDF